MKNFYFLFAVFLLSLSNSSYSQVNSYNFSQTITGGAYTALGTATTAFASPWDDNPAVVAPLGFTFQFDGIPQTQCFINPNGFLTFGATLGTTSYYPLSDPTILTNGGAISALGMNLVSNGNAIIYSTTGTAPNRTFVVEWVNARRPLVAGNFNFQIRLNESSNAIVLAYGICAPATTTVNYAQVGIRGASADFLQGNINNRSQNGADNGALWLNKTVTGTANSSTVRTSSSEGPNANLRYTYTPAAGCTTPTGTPSNLLIGNTAVTATTFDDNSFAGAIPASTNYLVLRSTINIPPSSTDVPNRVYWAIDDVISATYTVISNSSATSFAQISLTPNTNYYYWVIPFNSNCQGAPFYNLVNMITVAKTTCIAAPTGLMTSTISGNSFNVVWSPVTGATDYLIDVSTNNAFTAMVTGYSAFSTAGATSLTVAGLSSTTQYYYRVRAVGIACSTNSSMQSVTTICGSFPIPYFQNFDTTAVGALPNCMSIANNNADATTWQIKNSLSNSLPNSYHLETNTATNSNDWFFTPGLNLTTGVTYRLKFRYNTKAAGSFAENLRVRMGNAQTEANMNVTLIDLPNIVNSFYQAAIVDFSIVSNGAYFIGFQGYSFANQSTIIIDDISVIVSPTCFEPTNLVVNAVGVTSATVSWDASVPAPANGYQYYISTNNVTPSMVAPPSGSVGAGVSTVSLVGLNASTLYYIWVRGNCSASDKSVWSLVQSFSTDCTAAAMLAVTNGTSCGGGTATLQATGTSGSTIEWFSDASATTLVGTGNTFVTPNIVANTTYYAQSKASGGLITAGPISPSNQGGTFGVETSQSFVYFSVSTNTQLQSIDVFPMNSGENIVLSLRNASNTEIANYTYLTSVVGGITAQSLNLGLDLAPGFYSILFDVLPASGLIINVDNATYPYNSSVASLTGNGLDNNFYLYAYNWKFTNICRSLITPVTAAVVVAPALSFSQTSTIVCKGEASSLVTVSGFGAYDTFTWSPTSVGITGMIASGFIFQPTSTTTYTLTASQSTGNLCSRSISYTITVKPEPPAINAIPMNATICEGEIRSIGASLVAAPPATIFEENFNGATNSWNKINSSVGGNVANTAWILRNSPYTYTSSWWNITLSSNDASQFYFTNSDASGPSGSNRTITILESPSFSTVGFTTASLSFFHYYRHISGNTAKVEVSTNGGTTWTTVSAYFGLQGGSSNFANAIIDLNAYINIPNVKLRFYYDATWDYGWAIDNVKVSGDLAVETTWTPNVALYTNAAATIPYITGTPLSVVFAKPTSNITYTATAIGSSGCSTTGTSTITVIPAVVPGILSANQIVCNGLPNDLVLSSHVGTIVRWEYATNVAFTVGVTTIANTAAVLTTAQIGTFAGDRFYRVVLRNSTCPIAYSNIVSIVKPSTTWNGASWSNGDPTATTKIIFNGNFSSSANLTACSVEVQSGNVIINDGHTLLVQNEVNVVSGSLLFENNASLVQVNTLFSNGMPVVNTGNITYRRDSSPMLKFDYTFWSSPVSPQMLASVSYQTPLFYEYDASIPNWVLSNSLLNMTPAKGYLIRAPSTYSAVGPPQSHTANFIGVPHTGTITIPIVGTANQFNLIGNPYPSAFDADLFLTRPGNVPVVDGTLYLWTHNTPITANNYSNNDYAVYNLNGGVGTRAATNPGVNNNIPDGKIAAGQGFFIKGLSSGTATFTNQMRISGNNTLFFRTADAAATTNTLGLEKHRFWLDVFNSSGAFKQLLVGYIETATNEMDRGFDGLHVDAGATLGFYVKQGTNKLSIQGRALPFNSADIIPLGFSSTAAGAYQVSLSNFDGLFTTQDIILVDNLLNTSTNLRDSNYSFVTEVGNFDNRFEVHFVSNTLSSNSNLFAENSIVVYKNTEDKFVIKSKETLESVEAFDLRGRRLFYKTAIDSNEFQVKFNDVNQVILLRIKTFDGVIVTKKVVN